MCTSHSLLPGSCLQDAVDVHVHQLIVERDVSFDIGDARQGHPVPPYNVLMFLAVGEVYAVVVCHSLRRR